jgi:SAM-dependent methyltransferase
MSTQQREIIAGYADAAFELIPRFEAVSSSDLYSQVSHLLPGTRSRVVDIGAGTGRDAGWLASRGCSVLAVEPVAAFRAAGATLHRSPRIEWLDDSLPTLSRLLQRCEIFDFVLLSASWQHIDSQERRLAMANLRALTVHGGRLLLSVRHGPGAPTRHCYSGTAEEAVELAIANAFRLVHRCTTDSIQARNREAGVTWTWLAFSAT